MLGYWQRPDENAEVLRDGWLYTGDIAEMDEDGYFRIVDRKKEIIIVSGLNAFPREVENVVTSYPGVTEAAAIGVPDELRDEAVKVFVILDEDAEISEREIIAYCRERLAQHKVPRAVEFRHELPKNLIGKLLRREFSEDERKKRESTEGE